MMTAKASELTEQLLALAGDQRQGLPTPIFRLVSQLTPLINVDLLVRDDAGRTLLTWREDEFHGPGWHIPGGIIRFKENIATRITKVAEAELGCKVSYQPNPLAMFEKMAQHRDVRGHFIALLYLCSEITPPAPNLQAGKIPKNGEWCWHDACPAQLICAHEIYRPYISPILPSNPS